MLSRRTFGKVLGGASVTLAGGRAGAAADFPTRPIRMLIGVAAGGPSDSQLRIVCEQVKTLIGQPIVVENRPGAAHTISMAALKAAAPDGYTVGNVNSTVASLPLVRDNLSFDLLTDYQPVCLGVMLPANLLVVQSSFPANNLQEFIAYAKANPGKLNYGSDGVGSQTHIAGEELKRLTGIDMQHIPFTGNATEMVSLLKGDIQLGQLSLPTVMQYVQAGELKALANPSAARSPLMPQLPTAIEQGLGDYVVSLWTSVWAPRGVPADVMAMLTEKFMQAYRDPAVKAKLEGLGFTPVGGPPDELVRAVKDELTRWSEAVRLSDIKIKS
jgi:tripartite-type tricarboxylate transporter receptor subunit TctC